MTSNARHSLLLLGVVALAVPAQAVTQTASVKATVVKPLTLVSVQNLNLGTVTLQPGTWSGATVGISQAGVLSCASTHTICSGAVRPAQFKVTGSNKQVVKITAPNVTMTNQSDPSKSLMLVVDSPGQVTITSSGAQGTSFNLGGSITLSSTTANGLYSGTLNVTVDYQ